MIGTNSYKKGFTIVEMLIAAAIFSLIFGSAIGIFVQAINLQKYNLSHQQLLNQTSYATEYISKALRMAQRDDGSVCFSNQISYDISDSNRRIDFLNYNDVCQYFYLNTANNRLYAGGGYLASELPLTSERYEIINLRFFKQGDIPGDDGQPRVTFFMEIQDRHLKDKPKVIIQTTVSQRNLDI